MSKPPSPQTAPEPKIKSVHDAIEEHVDKMNDAYFAFVDRVITMSTGALALSITFRTSFVKAAPSNVWILKVSWCAFVLAIIAALAVSLGRALVHRETARRIRDAAREAQRGEREPKSSFVLAPPRWFTFMGFVMSVSFGVAITAWAAFAMLNLG